MERTARIWSKGMAKKESILGHLKQSKSRPNLGKNPSGVETPKSNPVFGNDTGVTLPESPASTQVGGGDTATNTSKTTKTRVKSITVNDLGENSITEASEAFSEGTDDNKSLWDQAYENLWKEKPEVVKTYEDLLFKILPHLRNASSSAELEQRLSNAQSDRSPNQTVENEPPSLVAHTFKSRRDMMQTIIHLGQERMDDKRIAYKIGTQEFVLQDQIQKAVDGIQAVKGYIGEAAKASSAASAAWVGVCLLLPLLTNANEVRIANEEGMAYISHKIQYYTAIESSLFARESDEFFTAGMKQVVEDHLLHIYQIIIDFQAQTVLRLFRRRFKNLLRDTIKWDPWQESLQRLKELGNTFETEYQGLNATAYHDMMSALAERTFKADKDSEQDQCLQCFKRGDYTWYKDRVEQRLADTGLWLLTHRNYKSWLKQESGPLLVSADPGCGKSVLARYLVDSHFGYQIPTSTVVLYFFFKEGDQNTVMLAFCALIHQLLCQRPHLMRHAIDRYKRLGAKLPDDITELWNILVDAINDPESGTIVIVLDALDECKQDEQNMQTLSRYLRQHFQKGATSLKILLTSRPYRSTVQGIQELEKAFPNIRINGEEESETIGKEINTVIEYRVEKLQLGEALRQHLKRRLLDVPHRTYLWLYLIFEYLHTSDVKKSTQGLDKAIGNLPDSVEEAYERLLKRSTHPDQTRKALCLVLAALTPLTLREMQLALDVAPGDTSIDMEPDKDFSLRLRNLCGLTVTVSDNKVYFLHQTVREFLLPRLSSWPSPSPVLEWGHTFSLVASHELFASQCMAYMDMIGCEIDGDYPFDLLAYAAYKWKIHLFEVIQTSIDLDDMDNNIPGLQHRIIFEGALEFNRGMRRLNRHEGQTVIDGNLKLLLPYLALRSMVYLLLAIDDAEASNRMPLATMEDHKTVVSMALQGRRVQVDVKDKHSTGILLLLAARHGCEAMLRAIFNRKENTDGSPDQWRNAKLLQLARGVYLGLTFKIPRSAVLEVERSDIYDPEFGDAEMERLDWEILEKSQRQNRRLVRKLLSVEAALDSAARHGPEAAVWFMFKRRMRQT
ncbi:hypothetical protein GGS20DRAFT_9185 [Poronia punctata]|nr:hypothetical protein GGS20DRAFT_9185 [Poronia punctata]